MSKKKYERGMESIAKQIDIHKNIYEKEIKRFEEQLIKIKLKK